MKPLRVGINGACGRMGLTLGRLLAADDSVEIMAALEGQRHLQLGEDYGEVLGVGEMGTLVQSILDEPLDVLIDFSTPEGALKRLADCVRLKIPTVICTTGFDGKQRQQIEEAAQKIPCLLSANMSIGVNLLFQWCEQVAEKLGAGYDVEIVETHHRAKKDAPSGTAKTLAERIAKARKALASAIPIHSVRAGDIVGVHTVVFSTAGETIEITHRAHSREIFARGAVYAAKLLAKKTKPGLYSFEELLDLKFLRSVK